MIDAALMIFVLVFVTAGFWWMDRTDQEMRRKQREIWDKFERETCRKDAGR